MGREGEADMTFAKHNPLLQSAVIWNAVVKWGACFYVYCLLERILDLYLWFLLLHGYCMVHLGVKNPDGSLSFLHKHSTLIISWSTSLIQHNWQPNLVHPSVGRMQDWQLKISRMSASTTKNLSGNSYPSIFMSALHLETLFPSPDLPILSSFCPHCILILVVSTVTSTQLILRSTPQPWPPTMLSSPLKFSLSSALLIGSPVPEHIYCLNWINPFPLSSSLG